MKTPHHTPALLLAVLLLVGCTTAASALHDRLAASPSERFAILRQQCRQVAGNDPRAARMIAACSGMERSLSTPSGARENAAAKDAFARYYEACVDESKRDGRLFSNHRKKVQAYYESRAVCDAYQGLFAARNAPAP